MKTFSKLLFKIGTGKSRFGGILVREFVGGNQKRHKYPQMTNLAKSGFFDDGLQHKNSPPGLCTGITATWGVHPPPAFSYFWGRRFFWSKISFGAEGIFCLWVPWWVGGFQPPTRPSHTAPPPPAQGKLGEARPKSGSVVFRGPPSSPNQVKEFDTRKLPLVHIACVFGILWEHH